MQKKELVKILETEDALRASGQDLAANFKGGEVLALEGPLGSGKTTFVQGIAQGLGVTEPVTSASFILVQSLPGKLWLHHFDCYRLSSSEAERLLLMEEYLESDGIVCIEWADRVAHCLPSHSLHFHFSYHPHPSQRDRAIRRIAAHIPVDWTW